MAALLLTILFIVICVKVPAFAKALVWMICLPILGFVFGGFVWSIAAIFVPIIRTFTGFVAFIALGVISTFVIFASMK